MAECPALLLSANSSPRTAVSTPGRRKLGTSRLEPTTDPAICHGQPVIRGLRYPVQMVLELLASGMSMEEVLADYPDLERDDLLAALEFAH